MNLFRRVTTIFGAGIFTLLLHREANACGACMLALFDSFMPSIMGWVLFAIFWYLAATVAAPPKSSTIPAGRRFLGALLFVMVFSFLGLTMFGPLLILLLLARFPFVIIDAFANKSHSKKTTFHRRTFAVVSLVALAVLCVNSIKIMTSRSPSAFILEWSNTYASKSKLENLIARGSQNASELRIVVEKGGPSIAAKATGGLAVIGDPEIDISLLRRKIENCRTGRIKGCDHFDFESFQNSLDILENRKRGKPSAEPPPHNI